MILIEKLFKIIKLKKFNKYKKKNIPKKLNDILNKKYVI